MPEVNKTNVAEKPETPVEKPAASAKVEVDSDVLKGILESLETLKVANVEKDEQIEILRQSVSRSRLEQVEEKNRPVGLPTADLMLYDGKVVVWFEMSKTHGKNRYTYNPSSPNTVSGEELFVKLRFVDGSETTVSYHEFINTKPRVKVVKIGEAGVTERNRDGVIEMFPLWVVEVENKAIYDKPLTVSLEYINP